MNGCSICLFCGVETLDMSSLKPGAAIMLKFLGEFLGSDCCCVVACSPAPALSWLSMCIHNYVDITGIAAVSALMLLLSCM